MQLDFWIDPACPWCWITSRWAEDIADDRQLDIRWRSISLLFKNDPPVDSPYYAGVVRTHGLLRVMEAVRAAEGDAPLGRFYTVAGEHIHHQGDRDFSVEELLTEAGLSTDYAGAFDDEQWDAVIRAEMDEGLALVGNDVGTPILAFDSDTGQRVGWFGPVISRRYAKPEALKLWDGLMMMAGIDGMWELKRTRTEAPNFDLPA
jgi:DSBA-like thioredoxin domain